MVIPVQHEVPHRLSPQPPEIKARFGLGLLLIGFVLTLPGMFAGTLFSMAVATGQAPFWPTVGEGIVVFGIVLAFFGTFPLLGFLFFFGPLEGARWVLLCLVCSGTMPALFLGGLLVFGAPDMPAIDLVVMEVALAWMWALPLLGLALMRATHTGRPLPSRGAFLHMFGSRWRERLPGVQTQPAEVLLDLRRFPLRVPGAEFAIPAEAYGALFAQPGRVRVTYDLRRGRIETIEVGV